MVISYGQPVTGLAPWPPSTSATVAPPSAAAWRAVARPQGPGSLASTGTAVAAVKGYTRREAAGIGNGAVSC